jgi:superfamily I DNA/RNA helicase
VDELGTDYLRSLAKRITAETEADYVILTVHRAKGLECKRVKVKNDFLFKIENGRLVLDDDELRLLYVATARAPHVLDASELREELIGLFASRP